MPQAQSSLLSGYPVATDLSDYGTVYLLPVPLQNTFWLAAGYKVLTDLTKDLRENAALRALVAGHGVRIATRDDDAIPSSPDQQIGFGAPVLRENPQLDNLGRRIGGKPTDTATVNQKLAGNDAFLGKATKPKAQSGAAYRATDQFQNLKDYWEKKTPECHHIVEDNQLRALGVSDKKGNGPLDHANLPCVLLAAQFHQDYITPILRPTRLKADTILSAPQRPAYFKTLQQVYASLYERNGTLFLPLWNVAKRILDEAKQRL